MNDFPSLVFPQHLLSAALHDLVRTGRPTVDLPLGSSYSARWSRLEWVVARRAPPQVEVLRVSWIDAAARPPLPSDGARAWVWVGRGGSLGLAEARTRDAELGWVAAKLYLPGPYLPEFAGLATPGATGGDGDAQVRWSRTRGALGPEIHDRLRRLSVGILGCGRSGSLIARNLARLGVRRLVLADPDSVELHNTGEAEYEPREVGAAKAQALAARLARDYPNLESIGARCSVAERAAVEAVKTCDVLVSTPDQPGARLAAAAIAAAYSRPLLDVGTRVLARADPTMGGDIRLALPDRCLLCLGGVGDEAEGLRLLGSLETERSFLASRDWRAERPGSLRSLNEICAGVAQRNLEDLAGGRLTGSLWTRLEFAANGRMTILHPDPQRSAGLPCFCDLAGWGDAALPRVIGLLARRAAG